MATRFSRKPRRPRPGPTQIGKRIRERREELGISANRLAKIAGVDRGTIASIEQGIVKGRPAIRQPHLQTIQRLTTALGMEGPADGTT